MGDTLYGKQHLARFFHRQALQAKKLGLIHPKTGEVVEWEIPLASDFADIIKQAGMQLP